MNVPIRLSTVRHFQRVVSTAPDVLEYREQMSKLRVSLTVMCGLFMSLCGWALIEFFRPPMPTGALELFNMFVVVLVFVLVAFMVYAGLFCYGRIHLDRAAGKVQVSAVGRFPRRPVTYDLCEFTACVVTSEPFKVNDENHPWFYLNLQLADRTVVLFGTGDEEHALSVATEINRFLGAPSS